MATVPVPATVATGDLITAALWNAQVRDIERWLLGTGTPAYPYVNAWRSAALTPVTATSTLVPFDAELTDTDGMHDLVTNPSRVIAVTAGLYRVIYGYAFAGNTTGRRLCVISKGAAGTPGGGTQLTQMNMASSPSGTFAAQGAFDYRFTAAEYLEMFVEQTSGGNLALNSGQNFVFITMAYIAP
jgi:hypothetical protein